MALCSFIILCNGQHCESQSHFYLTMLMMLSATPYSPSCVHRTSTKVQDSQGPLSTMERNSMLPFVYSLSALTIQQNNLHILKEVTSTLFTITLLGVTYHFAVWGLQAIIAPFIPLLNGPLTSSLTGP